MPAAAEKFNINLRTWTHHERCLGEPGSGALLCLAEGGININWLLTGKGEMLLSTLEEPSYLTNPTDLEALINLTLALDDALKTRNITIQTEKKVQLIQFLFEYYKETGKQDASKVEKFLKLVT
jgi:hypothetical protein